MSLSASPSAPIPNCPLTSWKNWSFSHSCCPRGAGIAGTVSCQERQSEKHKDSSMDSTFFVGRADTLNPVPLSSNPWHPGTLLNSQTSHLSPMIYQWISLHPVGVHLQLTPYLLLRNLPEPSHWPKSLQLREQDCASLEQPRSPGIRAEGH